MTDITESGEDTDASSQVVYRLASGATLEDLTEGARYHGTVDGLVDYGMFVRLTDTLSGLVHESEYDEDYSIGDQVIVELMTVRENGDLSFTPVDVEMYQTVQVGDEDGGIEAADLEDVLGDRVHLEAVVVQIKQTAGPTVFSVSDGTGVVPCAAFKAAGVRAFPAVTLGDIVYVTGTVGQRGDGLQIEVENINRLTGDRAETVRETIVTVLSERSQASEIDPLVDWAALQPHIPELDRIATRLKRAVLESRPIIIRHHADTDGMCASVPLERALKRFTQETHANPNDARHLLSRLPSKAPFYDIEDVTRDLNKALEGQSRHGQQLPLVVMIDNGSTEEDVPAFKQLSAYDIPIIVIDHHHPDPEAVEPYVTEHVNPYLHGEDYRVTTGMLCVELSRMITPEITSSIRHVPAIAGLADRSAADEMTEYLELARESGYERDDLMAIDDALDYAAYALRYNPGQGVIQDALGIGRGTEGPPSDSERERHQALVELLSSWADYAIDRQISAAIPHVESERLSNGVWLNQLDLDEYAYRFTYPAPGTTTGALHDRLVRQNGDPAITIGYGPNFAVLRSDGVRLDIPQMVSDLNEEFGGAGVRGGGHLVVGSIQFVSGMRETVLEALIEKLAVASIDESLGVTAPRQYGTD